MAWSASKIFMAFLEDVFENTTAMDLNTDTFKIALYDNDITPDQTVTSANTAYNAGQWTASGNEVADGTEWDAGGEPLTGVSSSFTSNVYKFDATDTPSGGSSATLANVYGGLILDDSIAAPVAKQGVCYLYFGGVNSVTDGTLTVIYHSSGIFTITA
jgi:hypothetical protein